MENAKEIQENAIKALQEQAASIQNLTNFIDSDFSKIVNLCLESKGRLVVTGIGKSAIIAQKIVATLNSTGTPSLFMHAADAIHGDLGMVQTNDIVLCISKSGNSPEIKALAPLVLDRGNVLIGMVGSTESFLAKNSNYILNTWVEKESCPNNLAPTSSTSAQMAMGDALAVCLIKLRDFGKEDFAKHHPGGALGKKLYLRVADLIQTENAPKVTPTTNVKEVIVEISAKRLGAAAVTENNKLIGIVTDGDIRRMLENHTDFLQLTAEKIMTKNPKSIEADTLAYNAYRTMEEFNITQLPVLNSGNYVGMVHLHDILKEGIF